MSIFNYSCAPSSNVIHSRNKRNIDDNQIVRICIYKTKEPVSVTSADKIKLYEQSGYFRFIKPKRRIIVSPQRIERPIYCESWNEIITVNGKRYRGMISFHNVAGTLYVINTLKLNEYLYGVVPVEMPAEWPCEALKAQAIAARTFAFYHIAQQKNMLYDLDATTSFQVYMGFDVEKETSNRAVDDTRGIVLSYEGRPILSFFHSTCGGKTADDRYVWIGSDLPYLSAVRCGYCSGSPNYEWEYELRVSEIQRALKQRFPELREINSIRLRKNDGRVSTVAIAHDRGVANLSGNDFRILISAEKIKSLAFDVKQNGRTLKIYGNGWGHGVGLCQWGAKGMAERGMHHGDILRHYYKGVSLKKLDSRYYTIPSIAHRVL
ncbi:MAG: SpoIID/LytB domain-containing protein [Spirochaetes bacterium]|nr:SpoIID/LytB domain-containing protein [Spirochaetota bacterium]